MRADIVSRRSLLMSSAAVFGAGVGLVGVARAAPPEDLVPDFVPALQDLANIREKQKKVQHPHKGSSSPDPDKNPYLKPTGEPLGADEQAREKARAVAAPSATGQGL